MDNQQRKIHHYVYATTDGDRYYIGMRQCTCEVKEDSYMGSHTDKTYTPKKKEILCVCKTREEANKIETMLLRHYDVMNNDRFVNRIDHTPASDSEVSKVIVKSLWDRGVYDNRKTNSEAMKRYHREGRYDHVKEIFTKAGREKIKEIKSVDKSRVEDWCRRGAETYWSNMTPERLKERGERVSEGVKEYWERGEGLRKKIETLEKEIEDRLYCIENKVQLKDKKSPARGCSITRMVNSVQRLERKLVQLKLVGNKGSE